MAENMRIQDRLNTSAGFRPTRQDLHDFLLSQPLGAIGTLGPDGGPQQATVAFSSTEDFEFVIGTDEQSRKALNIGRDPRTSFVVTDPQARYTVQLQGKARKLTSEEFDERYAAGHFEKSPASVPFKDEAGQVHFVITPSWLRFSDCNPNPWVLTEFSFDESGESV